MQLKNECDKNASVTFVRVKRSPLKRAAILLLGWLLLLVGAVGGLIPILQGWPFGIAGLIILSKEYEWAHDLVVWVRRKFPKFAQIMDKTSSESYRILNKFFRRNRASEI